MSLCFLKKAESDETKVPWYFGLLWGCPENPWASGLPMTFRLLSLKVPWWRQHREAISTGGSLRRLPDSNKKISFMTHSRQIQKYVAYINYVCIFGALFTLPRIWSCFIQSLVSCGHATIQLTLESTWVTRQHIRGSKNDAINLEGHDRYMSQLDNGVQILMPIFRTQNVTQIECDPLIDWWLQGPNVFHGSQSEGEWEWERSTTQTIKESHRGGNKYTLHDTPATQINHFVFVILRPPYILAKAPN